jgi:hypothetical protein
MLIESPKNRILGFPAAPEAGDENAPELARIPKQSTKTRRLIANRVANPAPKHNSQFPQWL